jgi:hypothetical protein
MPGAPPNSAVPQAIFGLWEKKIRWARTPSLFLSYLEGNTPGSKRKVGPQQYVQQAVFQQKGQFSSMGQQLWVSRLLSEPYVGGHPQGSGKNGGRGDIYAQ